MSSFLCSPHTHIFRCRFLFRWSRVHINVIWQLLLYCVQAGEAGKEGRASAARVEQRGLVPLPRFPAALGGAQKVCMLGSSSTRLCVNSTADQFCSRRCCDFEPDRTQLVGRLRCDWALTVVPSGKLSSHARHASQQPIAACPLRFFGPSSLGYVEGNTVQLKGRVACEINTCDELIATEMVFENVLECLDPPEIAGWS